MRNSKRTRAVVAIVSAVAGLSLLGSPARAQNRIDTSGRALDANTQVGSGGYNVQNTSRSQYGNYGNAVVTGNSTNGYGFRGVDIGGVNLGAGYLDPFAFRHLLPGQGVDQFIANSTGVPTMANPTASSQNYAAPPNASLQFYGQSNHAAPPAGFQPLSNSAGYVPAQSVPQNSADTRIGAIDFSGTSQIIPKPYEMILPGPVDPTANPASAAQQMLGVSPLYGVVNWSMTPQSPQQQMQNQQQNLAGQSPLQQGISPTATQGLTLSQMQAIRQELASQSASATNTQTDNATPDGSRPLNPLRPGGQESAQGEPLGSLLSQSSQLTPSNLSPSAGDVSTDQSIRQYPVDMALPPPGQQSAQFSRLREALDQYNSKHPMTDEEANRNFQQIMRLREKAKLDAENGSNVIGPAGVPLGNPTGIPNPEQAITPNPDLARPPIDTTHLLKPGFNSMPNMGGTTAVAPAPAPVPVDNFASGIKSKGLADLISTGEVQVQHGQYDNAIATYNQAIDVVPNNPLILMARATAELGGGYYSQANADIHMAVAEDPAVLVGQYDLDKHLGQAKLHSIVEDLRQISKDSADDALHAFLLTFTYYNSNHVGQAAEWLQIADKRSNGQDPAIMQMKKYWNFSESSPVAPPPSTSTPQKNLKSTK